MGSLHAVPQMHSLTSSAQSVKKNPFLTLQYERLKEAEVASSAVATKKATNTATKGKKKKKRSKKRAQVKRRPVAGKPKKSGGPLKKRKSTADRGTSKRLRKGRYRRPAAFQRRPLKNTVIKVSSIRPAKAQSSWKRLQREPLFTWPIESQHFWVSSLYGPRRLKGSSSGFHAGVDLAAVRGTPVHAAENGVVEEAAYASGYGNYILIAHNRKFKTRYAHLDKIHVYAGQTVSCGDCIGRVGSTGFVRKSRRGARLHIFILKFI